MRFICSFSVDFLLFTLYRKANLRHNITMWTNRPHTYMINCIYNKSSADIVEERKQTNKQTNNNRDDENWSWWALQRELINDLTRCLNRRSSEILLRRPRQNEKKKSQAPSRRTTKYCWETSLQQLTDRLLFRIHHEYEFYNSQDITDY